MFFLHVFGRTRPEDAIHPNYTAHQEQLSSSFLPTIKDFMTYKLFRHGYTNLSLRGKISPANSLANFYIQTVCDMLDFQIYYLHLYIMYKLQIMSTVAIRT